MAYSPNDKFFANSSHDVIGKTKVERCNFFWINDKGDTVRCTHSNKKNHGPLHEHGLSSVRVGEEQSVSHEWIKV